MSLSPPLGDETGPSTDLDLATIFRGFETSDAPACLDPMRFVRRILDRRAKFGITRLGSLTRLERAGIAVAQAVRPLSLSLVPSHGKGLRPEHAAVGALMESLEGWASQTIAADRTWRALPDEADPGLWSALWRRCPPQSVGAVTWIAGWDLLSDRVRPVPLALVDTVYTLPSPHPPWMPRDTTGLAAAPSLALAVRHACLEVLERVAVARARAWSGFFAAAQINPDAVTSGRSAEVLRQLKSAGLIAGIWRVPGRHSLPVYWCQVMEDEGTAEYAPLPADGFACRPNHDDALLAALLEAYQARVAAIAGGREDLSQRFYGATLDRRDLALWRAGLNAGTRTLPRDPTGQPASPPLAAVLNALVQEGARAVIAVPLALQPDIPLAVVRVVAPPLLAEGAHDAA